MTMQALGGAIPLPIVSRQGGGGIAHSISAVDGDGDGVALVFAAPKDGNIRQMAVALSATATAGDLDYRVETLNASGGPSGTLWATNTNLVKAIGAGDDNVWMLSGNLTASAAVSAGQLVAVKAVRTSGTLVTEIRIMSGNAFAINLPCGHLSTAGTFAKSAQRPHIMIEYDDGEWFEIDGAPGYFGISTTTFSSASDPNEIGNEFNLPFGYRMCGAWFYSDAETAHLIDVAVFDNAGTPVELAVSDDIDTDAGQTPGSGNIWMVRFDRLTVPANTPRHVVLRPDATAISYAQMDWTSSIYKNVCNIGPYVRKTHRNNSGSPAFTSTALSQVLMGILIDGIDDGAGGGGGIFIPRRRVA